MPCICDICMSRNIKIRILCIWLISNFLPFSLKAQYEFTDVHTAFVSAKIDKVAEINDRKMLIVELRDIITSASLPPYFCRGFMGTLPVYSPVCMCGKI